MLPARLMGLILKKVLNLRTKSYQTFSMRCCYKKDTKNSSFLCIFPITTSQTYIPDKSVFLIFMQILMIVKNLWTCIEEILFSFEIATTIIVIDSDNCSSQYKSVEHFFDLQCVSNHTSNLLIRIFGIAEHGKWEVDEASQDSH